jgi:hypothetical protein
MSSSPLTLEVTGLAPTISACGSGVDADIGGFTVTVPNRGGAAHGAGVVYGDDIYTALYGGLVGQWTVFTKLKCNKMKGGVYVGPSGWVGIASISMLLGSVNAGPLSCAIPGKNGSRAHRRPVHRPRSAKVSNEMSCDKKLARLVGSG